MRTLVTGGTGTLGRPTVDALRKAGVDVEVLSRKTGPGVITGNLLTGDGIAAALRGIHTVVHLATGTRDVAAARTLLREAESADVKHLVYISIVGVDRIPLGYYKQKLEVEQLIEASGVPHTILRATQFHQLVETLFAAQRFVPVILAPAFSIQPIDVTDVAARLVEIATMDARGRVPDIGGPEQRTATDLAEEWKHGTRRVVTFRLPGATFAGYAAGHNLVPGTPYGTRTFGQYLASK
jgi:uncharacterized protein YbjT (DUF2867 family)